MLPCIQVKVTIDLILNVLFAAYLSILFRKEKIRSTYCRETASQEIESGRAECAGGRFQLRYWTCRKGNFSIMGHVKDCPLSFSVENWIDYLIWLSELTPSFFCAWEWLWSHMVQFKFYFTLYFYRYSIAVNACISIAYSQGWAQLTPRDENELILIGMPFPAGPASKVFCFAEFESRLMPLVCGGYRWGLRIHCAFCSVWSCFIFFHWSYFKSFRWRPSWKIWKNFLELLRHQLQVIRTR